MLLVTYATYSIELSFLSSCFVILLTVQNKINSKLFTAAKLLLILFLIGLLSSFKLENSLYETLKDSIYFLRPISMLLAVYFIIKRVTNSSFVFHIIIFISLLFALKHIYVIVSNISAIQSYVDLRTYGGKQNHIELIALIFLLFTPFKSTFGKYSKLIRAIIVISFVLYLSRTMFIILFIYWLGYKGFLFLNRKLINGIITAVISVLILTFVLSFIEVDRNSTGFKAFIYKTKNSYSELFESIDTNKILRDRRELWEHWRAYESKKAIEQMTEAKNFKVWSLGFGYGKQIDLGTYVNLDGKKFTELPSIHNGFVNVLFKTGILGLLVYLSFLSYIFISYQKFNIKSEENLIVNKLIIATSIYMLINSFVIAGFFRPGEFSIVLYSILVASNLKVNNYKNEST